MGIRLNVVSTCVGLLLLAACGPGDPSPVESTATPQQAGSLTIWSGWGDYQVLQELCDAWAEARSASCGVFPKALDDLKRDFERAVSSGGEVVTWLEHVTDEEYRAR